jgi:hypothetical protein
VIRIHKDQIELFLRLEQLEGNRRKNKMGALPGERASIVGTLMG